MRTTTPCIVRANLAAQIARIIAPTALAALGFSGAPVHAGSFALVCTVTVRNIAKRARRTSANELGGQRADGSTDRSDCAFS
jgi:hypothetical protein